MSKRPGDPGYAPGWCIHYRAGDLRRGLDLLAKLRPDQIEHVRHLLRSWCGTGISEANVHMPICRRAIRRTLNDRP